MQTAILTVLALATVTGLVFVHLEAKRRAELWALLVPLDLVAVVLTAVASLHAATFEAWMQEDAWAEWTTVHAFVAAAVVVGLRIRRWEAAGGWLPRLCLAAVAFFCIFVAGEEISWGQRLFAFEPPDVFLEKNYQQELNVHNLLKDEELAGFELDSRFLVALIAVVYGGVLPLLRKLGRAGRLQPSLDAVTPPWELAPFFGAIAVVELSYPADLAGEACELVLGLLFLAGALWDGRPPRRGRSLSGLLLLPFGLGLLTQPLVAAIVYGPDEALVAQTQAELEQLSADLIRKGVMKKRLRKKSRVHKRVFTAVQAGYFEPGSTSAFLEGRTTPAEDDADDPRRDRQGYFLDPWNNPYWILVTKKGRRGILYSFGPNRRRDTRMPKKKVPRDFAPSGDDVAVLFSVNDPGPAPD